MAQINEQSDYQKTALRIPKDLHAKIIESAKTNNRTMNAEIIERLGDSFEKKEVTFDTAISDILEMAIEKVSNYNNKIEEENRKLGIEISKKLDILLNKRKSD